MGHRGAVPVMPWHEGRTFYACPCGAQDERTRAQADHPATLDCWLCKEPGAMKQWIPPAVKRERDATAALSADVQGNLL